jgi:hypothetical protein
MEGSTEWKRHFCRWFASVGLLLVGAAGAQAELLCSTVSSPTGLESGVGCATHSAGFQPIGSERTSQRPPSQNWLAALKRLRKDWEETGESWVLGALEMTVTLFFIRVSSDPDTSSTDSGNTPPPPTGSGTDPGGGGDPGGGDPGGPGSAPEPASIISALIGVGVTSLMGWRRCARHAHT